MQHEIYLAGGCFWGLEMFLSLLPGVQATECSYVNGYTDTPRYEDVCRGDTGYAEAVRVRFDDEILPLPKLLELFYSVIDPTSVHRQGGDIGSPVPHRRILPFRRGQAGDRNVFAQAAGAIRKTGPG